MFYNKTTTTFFDLHLNTSDICLVPTGKPTLQGRRKYSINIFSSSLSRVVCLASTHIYIPPKNYELLSKCQVFSVSAGQSCSAVTAATMLIFLAVARISVASSTFLLVLLWAFKGTLKQLVYCIIRAKKDTDCFQSDQNILAWLLARRMRGQFTERAKFHTTIMNQLFDLTLTLVYLQMCF